MDTLPTWLRVAYQGLLFVGAFACWGFIARYVTHFRWWTTEIGRHLIVMSAIVGMFYTYFAVATIWPNLPGRVLIRTLLFIALTFAVCWRWVMFERLRRQTKRDKEPR